MTENKRIIKFRGKRVDNGEWVYGSYHFCVGSGTMTYVEWEAGNRKLLPKSVEFDRHWILVHHSPEDVGWDMADTYTEHNVLPDTVGQFTGLLDKSGKEIYEGDILKEGDVIKFERGCFWIYKKERTSILQASPDGCYPLYRIDMKRFAEVIGNIYENPELIADENQL